MPRARAEPANNAAARTLAALRPGLAALTNDGGDETRARAQAVTALCVATLRARAGLERDVSEDIVYALSPRGAARVTTLDPPARQQLLEPLLRGPTAETLRGAPLEALGRACERWRARDAGVVYTPPWLARELVELTAGALAADDDGPPRILDPACGAGHCLVASARWLARRYPARPTDELLTRALFGVDHDPVGVLVARVSLLLWALARRPAVDSSARARLVAAARDAVHHLDALRGPPPGRPARRGEVELARALLAADARQGFDVVLGNPPYIDAERMAADHALRRLRRYCGRRYEAARGNWDLFCVFIERALELLRPGGAHGFIVPNKLLSAEYAAAARRLLLTRARLLRVRELAGAPAFAGAAVYPILYVARSTCPKDPVEDDGELALERALDGRVTSSRRVARAPRFPADGGPWITALDDDALALRAALERFPPLGEHALVCGGATVAEAYSLAPLLADAADERERELVGALRVINSGLIDPYHARWGAKSMRYLGRSLRAPVVPARALALLPARRLRQARRPKLIVAGMTRRLEVVADPRAEYLAAKSTTIVLPDDAALERGALEYLEAVLNSDWMTRAYRARFAGLTLSGGYLRVGPPQLRALPVRPLSDIGPSERALLDALLDDVRQTRALARSLDTDNAVDTTSIHEALRARRDALERATRTLHGLP
ncbi:MAG: N-6 DNA methylase [Myxococcales bacterium]|nr:N-6 DNA methylase [Myxococcales bacterium]